MKQLIKKIIPRKYLIYLLSKKRTYNTNINIKNVLFVIQRTEVFTSSLPLINEISRKGLFNIICLVLPRADGNGGFILESIKNTKEYCFNNIKGEILEYKNCVNIKELLKSTIIDYVFINIPYNEQYPEGYKLENLSDVGKLCYLPYGFGLLSSSKMKNDTIPITLLSNANYIFAANSFSYKDIKRDVSLREKREKTKLVYNYGYPRFDILFNKKVIKEKRTTVLWLPRWTTKKEIGNEQSTFLLYVEDFIKYAEKNKNIDFIIRPHPLMISNFLKNNIVSEEYVKCLYNKIETIDNLQIDNSDSYVDVIQKSDILFADFSSLVVEFYILGKPIIYTGKKESVRKELSFMIDSFYNIDDWNGVELALNELINGNDYKKNIRKKTIEKFCTICPQGASKKIVDKLLED